MSKNSKQINFDNKKIINMIKKNLKKYSIKDTVELISKSEKISKEINL